MLFPKAAMTRAVVAALPEGLIAPEETILAFNESCSEFISMVASEAKELGSSSVMSQKDVVAAMKKLGLEQYLEEAEAEAAADVKRVKARKKRKRNPAQSKEDKEAAAKRQQDLLQATAETFYREQGHA